ncbi:hypothetical protein FS592_16005 [Serratia plymuthica]|nr:hypothetical protein F7687_23900 [Serratia marcescens]UJE00010.1 hypothetical protein FS592_16005 [Serratia plymuthica]
MKQGSVNIMARVIEPTNDAGYMVANRIESVLVNPGRPYMDQPFRTPYGVPLRPSKRPHRMSTGTGYSIVFSVGRTNSGRQHSNHRVIYHLVGWLWLV